MMYFLLGAWSGSSRRKREAAEATDAVTATISRLEVLADNLAATTAALEELVHTLREEEEGAHQ